MSDDKIYTLPGVDKVSYFTDVGATSDETRVNMIEMLEGIIGQIRDGQTVGVGVVTTSRDHCGGWCICGCVGSYSMLGAADVLRQELLDAARGSDT